MHSIIHIKTTSLQIKIHTCINWFLVQFKATQMFKSSKASNYIWNVSIFKYQV